MPNLRHTRTGEHDSRTKTAHRPNDVRKDEEESATTKDDLVSVMNDLKDDIKSPLSKNGFVYYPNSRYYVVCDVCHREIGMTPEWDKGMGCPFCTGHIETIGKINERFKTSW
jgi:hypothetical protein